MTLDQCYNTYKGTVVLVDGNPADAGQCVQWADVVLAHVYGFVTHYGNAIDWWNDPGDLLTDGFQKITDGSVKKGDFVVFNTLVGSKFGHIDVAMGDGSTQDFTGSDCNWNKDMTVHLVHHVGAQYVLGSLRLKGASPQGASMLNDNGTKVIWEACFRKEPSQADLDFWRGKPWDVCLTTQQATSAYEVTSNWMKIGENADKPPTVLAPGNYTVK